MFLLLHQIPYKKLLEINAISAEHVPEETLVLAGFQARILISLDWPSTHKGF